VSTPAPRPALKKAADAHIHPAAPGHSPRGLRQAADSEAIDDAAAAAEAAEEGHRLSGPPHGTTSDSLRSGGRRAGRRGEGGRKEKLVDLGVQVPKALRKELRAAAKASKRSPDEIVTALLQGWLNG
jgi:hypothetical protein